MNRDKFTHALGLCARAGRLAAGHDAVKDSVRKRRAKLIVFTSEASERLKGELSGLAGEAVIVLSVDLTNEDIKAAAGKRAAVLSVNDNGLAKLVRSAYECDQ